MLASAQLIPSADAVTKSASGLRSEEHTSELQSQSNLVCRLLLEKKKKIHRTTQRTNRRYHAPRESRFRADREHLARARQIDTATGRTVALSAVFCALEQVRLMAI